MKQILKIIFLLSVVTSKKIKAEERKLQLINTPDFQFQNMSQQQLIETAQQAQNFLQQLAKIPTQPTQQIPQQIQQPIPQTIQQPIQILQPVPQQSEFIQQEEKIDQDEGKNDLTSFIKKNFYLCLLKSDFCKVQCQDECQKVKFSKKLNMLQEDILPQDYKGLQLNEDEQKCYLCRNKCDKSVNNVCLGNDEITYVPISKESFYTFQKNQRNCSNVGYVCAKLCFQDYCKDQFSARCAQCKVDCNIGAKSGCFLSSNKFQETNFKKIYEDFEKGKDKLSCTNCESEVAYYCRNECDAKNRECLEECKVKSQLACRSHCTGNTQYFYYKMLKPQIKNMLRNVSGNCNNCQELCSNEQKIVCYKEDKTCQFLMNEKCKNKCLETFCEVFKKKKERRKKERKLLNIDLLWEQYRIIMSRAQAKQKLRTLFDTAREKRLRQKAFQRNRSGIIKALENAENQIYDSQKKNELSDKDKNMIYETEFNKKMTDLLANPSEYEEMKDSIYGIWED